MFPFMQNFCENCSLDKLVASLLGRVYQTQNSSELLLPAKGPWTWQVTVHKKQYQE